MSFSLLCKNLPIPNQEEPKVLISTIQHYFAVVLKKRYLISILFGLALMLSLVKALTDFQPRKEP